MSAHPHLLPAGKLPLPLLEKLLTRFAPNDPRIVVGPRTGEDAAVFDFGDRYLVAKTDPITFATSEIGWYAVNVNANDVAVMGATPRWFLATVLLPAGQATAEMAERIFADISDACAALGVSLAGGHTEITHNLDRPIICGTMLGEIAKERLITTAGRGRATPCSWSSRCPSRGRRSSRWSARTYYAPAAMRMSSLLAPRDT